MIRHWRRLIGAGLVGAAALLTVAPALKAQEIPTIRFGRQTAAEDNLWLMIAKPDLAPNLGKAYKIDWNQFRASDIAFKGFESGSVDLVTTSGYAVITAAVKGVDLKIIASMSREVDNGAKTVFLVKSDGPSTIADLKGKTISIVGYRSSIELWARAALRQGGLDPDIDVNFAVVPFSAVPDAVRSGTVAAGGVVGLFAKPALAKGDLKVLFSSKTGIPHEEELILMMGRPAFLTQHPDAVKAFLSDLVTVTRWYDAHLHEARQALLDAKLVGLPPALYFDSDNYEHEPSLKPSLGLMNEMQDVLLANGYIDEKADLSKFLDTSYLPH